MADMCGDNRFEIIARAKKDLLEGTNIETDEDEMKVIDNILFRCWQMGWLDRYDTADTPQTEEKHAICNGCVYCDLPNAFHPCASCVDFSKYVGEESGDTPQTENSESTDCAWK